MNQTDPGVKLDSRKCYDNDMGNMLWDEYIGKPMIYC